MTAYQPTHMLLRPYAYASTPPLTPYAYAPLTPYISILLRPPVPNGPVPAIVHTLVTSNVRFYTPPRYHRLHHHDNNAALRFEYALFEMPDMQ
eukprot:3908927-Rhodomonas_salina.2